ncbi:YjbH domain-containing protein [uncultured Phocaeicola sp.]|uniref:YjbH domain-containing protein n=2 Tax=uncultured Phocaeicola sp. TaxID=990718 RepID=UPI0014340A77|nr:YjbH domain-containing protein [uncultured Phocaeicola sp.]GFI00151.1 hypothetical protein IMSAGC004_02559 [Bacteroidaceae bacterium]
MGFISNKKRLYRVLTVVPVFLSVSFSVSGQALRGTTGLLHAPTADMQRDKTFMLGGNVLDITPLHYYDFDVRYTFNYYLNITIFPWLEVGYTCTLNYANKGSTYFPEQSWGKYTNQDRSFNFRLRVWKEGWWKTWTPQIVIGADDPGTHDSYGGGGISSRDQNGGNCFFTRYYIAATKHIGVDNLGMLGVHLAWVLDRPATWEHHNRLAIGVNFRLDLPAQESWAVKMINGLNLMAEYDARTCNVGFEYSFWKDYVNLVAELNNGKYFSGGLVFKVHLK